MRSNLVSVVFLLLCASACAAPGPPESPPLPDPASVTIVRDRYGVPHVYGPTDASVVLGLGYAQAEDDLLHVEDNFVRALGRASELYGEETWKDDVVARALGLAEHARAEYRRAKPEMRAIYDAYAAGLNLYLERHPDRRLRLLERFEPWHTLAFLRFKYYEQEFIGYAGVRWDEIDVECWRDPATRTSATPDPEPWVAPEVGSNAWAVTSAKSAEGRALLFINPHVAFFGPGLYYESHLVSGEGWNFSGVGRYGFPFPYMGHNDRLGWGHTDNYHDHGDLYLETFDDASDPLAYRYGNTYLQAEEWSEELRVVTDDRVERRTVTFRRTHHGPILMARDGKPVAVKLARLEEGGWFDQHRAMTKARSLEEFRAALARNAIPYMNVTYADADGNAYYVYNGVVPRRSPYFDWSEPVDGSNPATEWKGYHALDELPQVLNPAAGFVLNTNSNPFTASTSDVPRRADFPDYMIGPEVDNERARVSRQILTERERFDFEEWARAALDTRVLVAPEWAAALEDELAELRGEDPERAAEIAPAVAELVAWDGVSRVDSTEMTLLVLAEESLDGRRPFPRVAALEAGIAFLEREWDTDRLEWGELNRLQRRHFSGDEPFDDAAPSVAVPGGPGRLGMAFVFHARRGDDTRRRYGRHGNSYVSVVEFGPRTRARSIVFFGQSADPDSPHHFDQAPIYGQARFKPAWRDADEVRAHAERSYHPGE